MSSQGAGSLGEPSTLLANRALLDGMVTRVAAASPRHPARAAALAQAAAEFAWFNHTGWYASPGLEAAMGSLGGRLPVGTPPDHSAGAPRGGPRTLHVVTQAYATGGSTQAVVSWTDELAHRAHHLVLTRQGTTAVPEKVTARLGPRVGLTRLDTRPGSLLQRAARLRAAAVGADLVLVHAHPYDVVPALAFARRDGLPPVVYVDHADHVFWLGTTSVDHVMHMRDSGRRLAQERRGLEPERSVVRNRPLAFRGRTMSRDAAKSEWGVRPEEVLLLSAAEPTKFVPVDGEHLAHLVAPLLMARPQLRWLVAGPSPDDEPWAALARRTQGRIRAVGRVSDMSVLHQAADLFLDSFPFASLTSLLESAALENPVVTYRGRPATCAVFGADSPGIDELLFGAADPDGLRRALAALVDDPEHRAAAGRRGAGAVVRSHGGPDWVAAMETLYDLPAAQDSRGLAPRHGTGQVDLMTTSVMAATAHRRDRDQVIGSQLGTMPLPARLAEWRGLRGAVGARALVPEWVPAAVRASR